MDKMLRAQIAGEVRRVLMEVLEGSQEQWVSADELGKHISFCTKDWLRLYGSTLPRTRAMVTTPDGETHQSAYTYPLHKIQRMLANNEVKFLKLVQYEKGFKKDNGNAYAGHYSSADCSLHRSVQRTSRNGEQTMVDRVLDIQDHRCCFCNTGNLPLQALGN